MKTTVRGLLLGALLAVAASLAQAAVVQTPIVKNASGNYIETTPTICVDTTGTYAACGGGSLAPSSASTNAVAPAGTTAAASSLVLCAAACNVYDFHVTATSVAGYLILVNATAAPSNGAITGVLACVYVGSAPGTSGFSYGTIPARASTGATLLFSTTGCHTLTLSATAEMFGRVQ